MLHVNDLVYRIAGRTLLDQATIAIPAGAKVGLVGRNGTGKTTLFRLIAGEIAPESGAILLPKGARIGQVAQEAPGSDISLLDFVLSADRERLSLLAEAETARDGHRIAEIHTRLADIGAHSAEARAAAILAGLGFDHAAQQKPCSAFSGGWRMRVALAAVLFAEPDLLLLDEPTNYLDLEGTLWLENYVARYPHTVIIISHDRDLLNGAVDTIVHLERGKLVAYRGGFDEFERQRRERQALDQKLKAKQDAQRAHMQAFVDRFRYKASKARQAQSRLKMLAKLQPIAALVDETVLPIRLPEPPDRVAPPIVAFERVTGGYDPDRPVLRDVSLTLDVDDRIALVGPNGNGKSTLAKLLTGRLKPFSGEIRRANKLRVAYFAQHQLDELIPSESPVAHVARALPDLTETKVRARVAAMGLAADRMDRAAENLSGGEKARLLLGLSTLASPHLLVLDEPTNHLDVDSREALIQAVNDYSGAVVLVSHDRHLLESCADRILLVADGAVRPFDGDFDDYRCFVLEGRASGAPARSNGEDDRRSSADRRRQAAQRRESLAPLRKRILAAENRISVLQSEISRLDRALSDPALFATDPAKGASLSKERAKAAADLSAAEDEWLALSERYEGEMAGSA